MITVELKVPVPGATGYRTEATLHVDDAGHWTVTGDRRLVDHTLRVRDPERGDAITLEDDPTRWARNLGTALRTGYLVAVVVEDTEAVISAEEAKR